MFELPQFSNIVNKLFLSFYNQKVHIYEKLYGFSIEVQVQILYVFFKYHKGQAKPNCGRPVDRAVSNLQWVSGSGCVLPHSRTRALDKKEETVPPADLMSLSWVLGMDLVLSFLGPLCPERQPLSILCLLRQDFTVYPRLASYVP